MFPRPVQWMLPTVVLCAFIVGQSCARSHAGVIWPGAVWAERTAREVNLVDSHLDMFIRNVGGDGCIVKDGYLIRSWGKHTACSGWFSAGKPVLSTLLMLAVAENRLPHVDAPVAAARWQLRSADHGMTFRHLANMVSGYARAEPPGAAWAYNDFAINLHGLSLKKIYRTDLDEVFRTRLTALQFEDKPFFGPPEGLALNISPRDFARLGWFWLHRGVWHGHTIIPRKLFDRCVRVGVPRETPRTSVPDEDYLGVGSFGAGTDQVEHGPGLYGFGFWFNEQVPGSTHRMWPSLPRTSFQANGIWNKHTVTMIPDWRMVVVVRNGTMGRFEPGMAESKTDKKFSLLRASHSAALRGAHKQ
jgi:CubicO group peptidase (beta-lactamase class C family)